MSKLLTKLVASCLFLLFVCIPVSAQSSTATLSGTIQDENGAVIPGAAIAVVNEATSFKRTATTNDSGSFTIPLLPPAEYTVLVEREGFTRVQLTNIVLNVGDQKAVQVQLKVGAVSDTVEVRPDETLINTSSAVTNTIDRNFAQNLPLNGRSFQSLILLTPGVTVTLATTSSAGQFSVNGQRSNANVFLVDGVSANTGVFNNSASTQGVSQTLAGGTPGTTTFGGTNGLVSADALEEFKIQTSTYSAEYGRQPGGQISLVTRSGKNQFQGSLFEYFRNEKLDANDWFANAAGQKRSALRQNIYGGTLSGPVFLPKFGEGGELWYKGRDRTFFFVSYEGLRLVLPQARTTDVPSLRLRDSAATNVRPLLNAFPLPTGTETLTTTACVQSQPPAPLNPRCSGTPSNPNGFLYSGFSPFTGIYSDPTDADIAGVRIDHKVNDSLNIFGRYNHAVSFTAARNTTMLARVDESEIETKSLTLSGTFSITPNLINETKVNLTNDRSLPSGYLDTFGSAVPLDLSATVTDLGTKGPRIQSIFTLALSSAVLVQYGAGFADTTQQQFNFVDNFTWISRDHLIKFGIDYRRLSPTFAPYDYLQNLTFTSEAQLQNGTVGSVNLQARNGAQPIFQNLSIYAQDTWKVSRKLTLDFGLRWELNPPPGGDGELLPSIIGMDNIPTATLAPTGTPIYKTDYKAFAPRIGGAYQFSDKKGFESVIRGGFGVYYDIGSGMSALGFSGLPFLASRSFTNQPFPLPRSLVPPPFQSISLPTTSQLTAFDSDFRLPYTLQWNLAVEQSLGSSQAVSASYVAAAGRRLTAFMLFNNLPPGGQRQNPNFGIINYISNGPESDYHSMQLQFRRRLPRGLQAVANYTWSHAIDEVSDETGSGTFERGNASFDVRHNFSTAITYELPGRKLKGFFGALVKNWSIDSIIHAQSAMPVNLTAGVFNREDGIQFGVRPDLVPGQPLYGDDPTVAGGRRFNSAALTSPPRASVNGPFLRQGNLGRNVFRGLPLYQVDLGLGRRFNLNERLNLQFKAEAFNIFNHPNFGNFRANITSPTTLGTPTQMLGRSLGGLSALYQIGGPRSIQFSLRVGF